MVFVGYLPRAVQELDILSFTLSFIFSFLFLRRPFNLRSRYGPVMVCFLYEYRKINIILPALRSPATAPLAEDQLGQAAKAAFSPTPRQAQRANCAQLTHRETVAPSPFPSGGRSGSRPGHPRSEPAAGTSHGAADPPAARARATRGACTRRATRGPGYRNATNRWGAENKFGARLAEVPQGLAAWGHSLRLLLQRRLSPFSIPPRQESGPFSPCGRFLPARRNSSLFPVPPLPYFRAVRRGSPRPPAFPAEVTGLGPRRPRPRIPFPIWRQRGAPPATPSFPTTRERCARVCA